MVRRRQTSALVDKVPAGDGGRELFNYVMGTLRNRWGLRRRVRAPKASWGHAVPTERHGNGVEMQPWCLSTLLYVESSNFVCDTLYCVPFESLYPRTLSRPTIYVTHPFTIVSALRTDICGGNTTHLYLYA